LLAYPFDVSAGAKSRQGVGGQAMGFSPSRGERTDIGPESATEEFLGGDQVTRLLVDGQLLAVDEGGLEPKLLSCDDGLDRGLDLAFEVVALIDHEGNIEIRIFGKAGVNLMEDAKDLVGIDGAEGEVVVGIAAIVEVEAAEEAGVEQPGDDLLDILRTRDLGPDWRAKWEDMPQSAMSV
jgi:hypothetical protein